MEQPTHLSTEQLAKAALSLPPEERAALAARIVESIEPRADTNGKWLEAAEKRRDEILSGKIKTISEEEVAARVRRHLG